LISSDVLEVVGVCPVRCVGVAAPLPCDSWRRSLPCQGAGWVLPL